MSDAWPMRGGCLERSAGRAASHCLLCNATRHATLSTPPRGVGPSPAPSTGSLDAPCLLALLAGRICPLAGSHIGRCSRRARLGTAAATAAAAAAAGAAPTRTCQVGLLLLAPPSKERRASENMTCTLPHATHACLQISSSLTLSHPYSPLVPPSLRFICGLSPSSACGWQLC